MTKYVSPEISNYHPLYKIDSNSKYKVIEETSNSFDIQIFNYETLELDIAIVLRNDTECGCAYLNNQGGWYVVEDTTRSQLFNYMDRQNYYDLSDIEIRTIAHYNNNTTVECQRDEARNDGREDSTTMANHLHITEKDFDSVDVDIEGDCIGHAIYKIKDSTSTVDISFEIDVTSEEVEEVIVSNACSPIDDLRLNDNSSVIDSTLFFSVQCSPFASNEYQVEYLSLDRMIAIIERTFSEDLQEYVRRVSGDDSLGDVQEEFEEEYEEEDKRTRKENVGSTIDMWVE